MVNLELTESRTLLIIGISQRDQYRSFPQDSQPKPGQEDKPFNNYTHKEALV